MRVRHNIGKVVILQILPRYEGARGNINAYNRIAVEVNNIIKARVQEHEDLSFHPVPFHFPTDEESTKLYKEARKLFKSDGVHLDELGQRRLWKSLRGLAIRVVHNRV